MENGKSTIEVDGDSDSLHIEGVYYEDTSGLYELLFTIHPKERRLQRRKFERVQEHTESVIGSETVSRGKCTIKGEQESKVD